MTERVVLFGSGFMTVIQEPDDQNAEYTQENMRRGSAPEADRLVFWILTVSRKLSVATGLNPLEEEQKHVLKRKCGGCMRVKRNRFDLVRFAWMSLVAALLLIATVGDSIAGVTGSLMAASLATVAGYMPKLHASSRPSLARTGVTRG